MRLILGYHSFAVYGTEAGNMSSLGISCRISNKPKATVKITGAVPPAIVYSFMGVTHNGGGGCLEA